MYMSPAWCAISSVTILRVFYISIYSGLFSSVPRLSYIISTAGSAEIAVRTVTSQFDDIYLWSTYYFFGGKRGVSAYQHPEDFHLTLPVNDRYISGCQQIVCASPPAVVVCINRTGCIGTESMYQSTCSGRFVRLGHREIGAS